LKEPTNAFLQPALCISVPPQNRSRCLSFPYYYGSSPVPGCLEGSRGTACGDTCFS